MILFNIFKHGLAFLLFILWIEVDIEKKFALAIEYTEEQKTKIITEIITPWTPVSDGVIQYFINFANEKMPKIGKKFKLLEVTITQWPKECNDHAKFHEDDVQIMYGGAGGDVGSEHWVGHYICVHYLHKLRRVHVYDSLESTLYPKQMEALQVLYPLLNFTESSSVKYIKPRTTQNDATSCGIFSIAYATTIIFGKNPETYKLQLNTEEGVDQSTALRAHLFDMLTTGTFSIFPSGDSPIRSTTVSVGKKTNKKIETTMREIKPIAASQKNPTTTPRNPEKFPHATRSSVAPSQGGNVRRRSTGKGQNHQY